MDSNNSSIRIGILGGIGPEATADFYLRLIDKLQREGMIKYNSDFPQLIINSIPAPELVYDNINEANLSMYIEGLKMLDSLDAEFIVMVCNTIHLFYERLQKEIATPIIDLRYEVRNAISKKNVNSLLLIGTSASISKGLYEVKAVNCVRPNTKETRVLSKAIFNFNKGIDKTKQASIVRKICKKYLDSGEVSTVLLGCTELGLMLQKDHFNKIDTMEVLLNATTNRFRKIKQKNRI